MGVIEICEEIKSVSSQIALNAGSPLAQQYMDILSSLVIKLTQKMLDSHTDAYENNSYNIDMENWVTMKGTHVLIGENGRVRYGPDKLRGKMYKSGISSLKQENVSNFTQTTSPASTQPATLPATTASSKQSPKPNSIKKGNSSQKTMQKPWLTVAPKEIATQGKKFSDGSAVNKYFYNNTQYKTWQDGLSGSHIDAITEYTGSAYSEINDFWRKQKNPNDKYYSDIVSTSKLLDTAIKKYNLSESITVYRSVGNYYGTTLADFKKYLGKDIEDLGYMSATPDPGMGWIDGASVVFEIDVPKGKGRGAYINKYSGYQDSEYEFLLARGSKLHIKGASQYTGGGIRVIAELVV